MHLTDKQVAFGKREAVNAHGRYRQYVAIRTQGSDILQQSETIICSLYAYLATGDEKYYYRHQLISEWTYAHFPDPDYGEWFGYLHRDGTPAQKAKGNLFKGPFHIPRMMTKSYTLCNDILKSL